MDNAGKVVLALAPLVAAAIILAAALNPEPNTCLVGDMQARLEARVPEALQEVHLDAAHMHVGLGTAAVGGWEGLGDALAAGGQVWVRHTNRAAPRYYRLVVNRYFQSNAFLYVPPGHAPAERWRAKPESTLENLLTELARKYPRGVVAAGYLHFQELHTIAPAQPALGGPPVLQHVPRYYTRPMESARAVWGYAVLLAARPQAWRLAPDASSYRFLPPPARAAGGHVQVLTLREVPGDNARPPRRGEVVAVGQAVGQTVVAHGELELFPVTRAAPCREAFYRPALP
jgi:hypothetical protein